MTTLLACDLSEGDLALARSRDAVASPAGALARPEPGPTSRALSASAPATTPRLLRPARLACAGGVPPGWPGVLHDPRGVSPALR